MRSCGDWAAKGVFVRDKKDGAPQSAAPHRVTTCRTDLRGLLEDLGGLKNASELLTAQALPAVFLNSMAK